MTGEELGLNSTGFGIAAQYELQVLRKLGIALRGAYLGVGMDIGRSVTESGGSATFSAKMDMKAISAEAHGRFYPFEGAFFLGGMLGYGNLMMDISGDFSVTYMGEPQGSQRVNFNALRHYAKVGPRVGWRIDFGNTGGFVFEPSLGYDHAFGLGDTFTKQFQRAIGDDIDIGELDDVFKILESYVLVGGPRVTLGFGWRF